MAEPVAAGEPRKHRRFELLDVLRFAAALMVVVFHWFFNGINNGKVSSIEHGAFAGIAVYGYFGVHLFFLISGFVIPGSAAGKSAAQFAVNRGVRLYPAFWVAVTVTAIVATIWGGSTFSVTVPQYLANLTMIPALFRQPAVDGVYWTLTTELSFYALVFAILFLGFGRFLHLFFPAWSFGMLAVSLFVPSLWMMPGVGNFYAFFASGAIIATILRRGFSWYQIAGLAAGLATALIFVSRQVESYNTERQIQMSSLVVIALTLAFFVAVALMWVPRVAEMRIPFSRPVSDLTYPVYLLHAHIGYIALNMFARPGNEGLVYTLMFGGLIAAAWLLHWGVEVKAKHVWQRLFASTLTAPVQGAQRIFGLAREPRTLSTRS